MLLDKVIHKYGYEHKITIFVAKVLDFFGKLWYNKYRK